MKKITEIAHDLLLPYVHKQAVCADFTMGNGYDTLFFADHAKSGIVYAFDVQTEAIAQTKALLGANRGNVRLILDNHIHMDQYITAKLDAAVFNFGYLPNGDKQFTTASKDSLFAVQSAFRLCKRHGLLVLVCYPGHKEGARETALITKWCESLNANTARIMRIEMVNKAQAPLLFAIEKLIDE